MTTEFVEQLRNTPNTIAFSDTMAAVDANYVFTEIEFTNGDHTNAAGANNGSCKLFAFAKLQGFSEAETLSCFGAYYRDDVLGNPNGDDHQNIRNFMKTGWSGITFNGEALAAK